VAERALSNTSIPVASRIIIKQITAKDIVQVHYILNEAFDILSGVSYPETVISACRHIYRLERLERMLLGQNSIALGAYQASRLIGCVWGYRAEDGTCAVDWAAVLSSEIGKGIFSRLMKALEARLKHEQIFKCYMFTSIKNLPAINRYLKLGYQIEGVHRNHFFGWDWLSIGKVITRKHWRGPITKQPDFLP
jgi:GNAT superfamily N-acetyltransferase